MCFVNEKFHNSALSGIFVSVPYSCALNTIYICAVTLHIRQTLAKFPVTHFVSVPYSCALNPINICAVTLHIHQTLATFPVTHFVSVPCSCALNPKNICAVTLHIRQTLATFAVTHFPPQLPFGSNFYIFISVNPL